MSKELVMLDEEYECPNCGCKFELSSEVVVKYSATPKLDVLKEYLKENEDEDRLLEEDEDD